MIRKLVGIVLLLIGVTGIAVSAAGLYLGRQAIDDFGAAVDVALDRTLVTLDTAADTLVLAKSTFNRVDQSLDTVGVTADNVATTLLDTQPTLENISSVVSTDIPDSLEAIQNSLPGVAQAAGAIDDTLRTLSAFEVSRELFGIPIQFDLGIDYNPSVGLDDSVLAIGDSLEGLPESLREMKTSLDQSNQNLELVSGNINDIADDLDAIGDNVKQIEPLIDDYILLIADIEELVNLSQEELGSQLEIAKLIVMLLFAWLALNQIVPIYLAVDIFTRDDNDESEGGKPPSTSDEEDRISDENHESMADEDNEQQEDDE
jgi:hypothetical protein